MISREGLTLRSAAVPIPPPEDPVLHLSEVRSLVERRVDGQVLLLAEDILTDAGPTLRVTQPRTLCVGRAAPILRRASPSLIALCRSGCAIRLTSPPPLGTAPWLQFSASVDRNGYMERICSACGCTKEHSVNRHRGEGRPHSECKDCARKRAVEYRKNNLQKVRSSNACSRAKLKMEVLSAYSGGVPRCSCCGESIYNFLTMDHVDGNGALHKKWGRRLTGDNLYRWLRESGFPQGFQVLCFNCNCGRRLGVCPHVRVSTDARFLPETRLDPCPGKPQEG